MLPELDTAESQRNRAFIGWLREQRPFYPTLHVIRWATDRLHSGKEGKESSNKSVGKLKAANDCCGSSFRL